MSLALQTLLKRATTYLNLSSVTSRKQSLSDDLREEVVYSKNNVCVHSLDRHTNQLVHNLGYLTIKTHLNNNNNQNSASDDQLWTLCLQWTPNECLTKHLDHNYEECVQNNHIIAGDVQNESNELIHKTDVDVKDMEKTAGGDGCDDDFVPEFNISIHSDSNNYKNITNSSHSSDSERKRRNSAAEDKNKPSSDSRGLSVRRCQSCRNTPLKRSLNNENSINTFSVDLKQIKSLRVFFGGEESESSCLVNGSEVGVEVIDNTSGQLVIVSRDSFYKVFDFHCGGLDRLLNVLNGLDIWDKSETSKETNSLQFSICRPKLDSHECHPEEELYVIIDDNKWTDSVNEFGQIIDEQTLRKTVFFAGIDPCLRRHIWPFLLRRYEFDSTFSERESDDSLKAKEYYEINKKLEAMSDSERDWFWRHIESIVEKDVPRTDRSNPYFAGDNNYNIDKMKRILINFALYCPQMGYTQGMSDLLAPLLCEIQCEHKTFWCFVSMMRLTRFVCSPKDTDMDHNLALLRELLRLMNPNFYQHIRRFSNDLGLLFTHRWILLCFKREFHETEALHIWESCWSHYQTHYFHLFICLAIICIYGKDVITHDMDSDEVLFHFSTLSMNMNGKLILRKARGLFHEFNILPKIPCSLKNVTKCGPNIEMWDNNREQVIECIKKLPNVCNSGAMCGCDPNTQ
ncbi:unnamed protein product [Oppiella nova]|uniref:Rab-GAP TBC domain-containing protein n=1 Tax=Oppiella nova TaxID=334625 RepID=A0A7R9MEN8_9ACAR|nr:unnamed protein product [Oppiella nova]CAG2175001.1 unnamed protein product [Oppiella nova]